MDSDLNSVRYRPHPRPSAVAGPIAPALGRDADTLAGPARNGNPDPLPSGLAGAPSAPGLGSKLDLYHTPDFPYLTPLTRGRNLGNGLDTMV